jgi:hypothetical protein
MFAIPPGRHRRRSLKSSVAPSYYVMAAAVVSFIVIARMPETAHRPLD